MNNPFNQLPTDPDWLRKAHAIGIAAAADLKCMTVLVAMQEDGKIAVCIDGKTETGLLGELADKGAPYILGMLSILMAAKDVFEAEEGARQ